MAPPIESFPVSELAQRVPHAAAAAAGGRGRRGKGGKGGGIELKKCELLEMVQFSCALEEGGRSDASKVIRCRPVVKLFRRLVFSLVFFVLFFVFW